MVTNNSSKPLLNAPVAWMDATVTFLNHSLFSNSTATNVEQQPQRVGFFIHGLGSRKETWQLPFAKHLELLASRCVEPETAKDGSQPLLPFDVAFCIDQRGHGGSADVATNTIDVAELFADSQQQDHNTHMKHQLMSVPISDTTCNLDDMADDLHHALNAALSALPMLIHCCRRSSGCCALLPTTLLPAQCANEAQQELPATPLGLKLRLVASQGSLRVTLPSPEEGRALYVVDETHCNSSDELLRGVEEHIREQWRLITTTAEGAHLISMHHRYSLDIIGRSFGSRTTLSFLRRHVIQMLTAKPVKLRRSRRHKEDHEEPQQQQGSHVPQWYHQVFFTHHIRSVALLDMHPFQFATLEDIDTCFDRAGDVQALLGENRFASKEAVVRVAQEAGLCDGSEKEVEHLFAARVQVLPSSSSTGHGETYKLLMRPHNVIMYDHHSRQADFGSELKLPVDCLRAYRKVVKEHNTTPHDDHHTEDTATHVEEEEQPIPLLFLVAGDLNDSALSSHEVSRLAQVLAEGKTATQPPPALSAPAVLSSISPLPMTLHNGPCGVLGGASPAVSASTGSTVVSPSDEFSLFPACAKDKVTYNAAEAASATGHQVVGTADPVVPLRPAAATRTLRPTALRGRVEVIPDSLHALHRSHPVEFIHSLATFCTELAGGR